MKHAKKIKALAFIGAIILSMTLAGCGNASKNNPPPQQTKDASEPQQTQATTATTALIQPPEPTVEYIVTSEEVNFEVLSCPKYGDRVTPFVTVQFTNGDPKEYNYIVLITVNGQVYGKKPYNDSTIPAIEGEQKLQYNTHDGQGEDYNCSEIMIFVTTKDVDGDIISPDKNNGYTVPDSQVYELQNNSVCAAVITREKE